MTDDFKELIFLPGCFDDFEGTQEELDAFIAEITRLFTSGDYKELSVPIEDFDEDELEDGVPRKLN